VKSIATILLCLVSVAWGQKANVIVEFPENTIRPHIIKNCPSVSVFVEGARRDQIAVPMFISDADKFDGAIDVKAKVDALGQVTVSECNPTAVPIQAIAMTFSVWLEDKPAINPKPRVCKPNDPHCASTSSRDSGLIDIGPVRVTRLFTDDKKVELPNVTIPTNIKYCDQVSAKDDRNQDCVMRGGINFISCSAGAHYTLTKEFFGCVKDSK